MEMEIVFPGGKKVDALYKGFRIQTDQPEQKGGEGAAPAPFDLFLSSIGTCSGIYVLSFLQERGLATEGLKLTMKGDYDPEKKLIGRIEIEILLPEGFPEKYKEAVIRTVELCTVKRHLEQPPTMEVHAILGGSR